MGEIKSTLDLVLERTKHLSLSEEEKREQEQAELRTRIKGLLLKTLDQDRPMEQTEKDLNDLKKDQEKLFQNLLREELLKELELEAHNRRPIILLRRLGEVKTDRLESLLHDYRMAIQKKASEAEQRCLISLMKNHAISGSAVVPHLARDPDWIQGSRNITAEFSQLLEAEKSRLLKPD